MRTCSNILLDFFLRLLHEYWKVHPEEFKEYMEQIDKKLESLKNEQEVRVN